MKRPVVSIKGAVILAFSVLLVFMLAGCTIETAPQNENHAAEQTNDNGSSEANNENDSNTNDNQEVQDQPSKEQQLLVDPSGNGDFTTIQAAIDSIPHDNEAIVTISITPGTYEEKLNITQNRIRLIGLGKTPEETVITYSDYWSMIGPNGEQLGIEGSASATISGNDFYSENVTFENPADKGQAVALHVKGDRAEFYNVRILGNQDTLYLNGSGRQYFKDSYIEGDADFIFGPATALFDNCTIHSVWVRYITAASTPEDQRYGFVFLNSTLTGNKMLPTGGVYLGRPWEPYANVVYINTEMGPHINKAGWTTWNDEDVSSPETARFYEYNSTGEGAAPDERIEWSKQLTAEEAAEYTVPNILGGEDNWIPQSYEG